MDDNIKYEMISILETLIYNPVSDLHQKLNSVSLTQNRDFLKILFYGNTPSFCIEQLKNRWSLNKQLIYHRDHTKKITDVEYKNIKNFFTFHIEK